MTLELHNSIPKDPYTKQLWGILVQKHYFQPFFEHFIENIFGDFLLRGEERGGGTVVQDPKIANFWFKPCIAIFNIH